MLIKSSASCIKKFFCSLAVLTVSVSCTFPPTNEDLKLTVVNPYPDLCRIYLNGEAVEAVVERSYWIETELTVAVRPLPGMEYSFRGIEISGYRTGGESWRLVETAETAEFTMTKEIFTVQALVDRRRETSGFWLGNGAFAYLSDRSGQPALVYKGLEDAQGRILFSSGEPLRFLAGHDAAAWGLISENTADGSGRILWVEADGTTGVIPEDELYYLLDASLHPLKEDGRLVAGSYYMLWMGNHRGNRTFLREADILKYYPGSSGGLVWIEGPGLDSGTRIMKLEGTQALAVRELTAGARYGFYPRPGGTGAVITGYTGAEEDGAESFLMMFDGSGQVVADSILPLEPSSGSFSPDGLQFLFSGEGKNWSLDLNTGRLDEGPRFPPAGAGRGVEYPGKSEDGAVSPDGRYRMVYRLLQGAQRLYLQDTAGGGESLADEEGIK